MNFDFLKRDDGYYDLFADACLEAEKVYATSPAMCIIGCRKALELAVRWVYAADDTIREPYRDNLASLIHEDSFRSCVDRRVWQGIRLIWDAGNHAVHTSATIRPQDAIVLLRALFDFIEWIDYCYGTDYEERSFDERQIPPAGVPLTRQQIEVIRQRESLLTQQKEAIAALEEQVRSMSAELTEARQQHQQSRSFEPEAASEYETRKAYIDWDLRLAGWDLERDLIEEREVHGMPVASDHHSGKGYIDYLLLGKDGRPLAIVEAKRTMYSPEKGLQQARLYAACLKAEYGYEPPIFLTNGFETRFVDDEAAPMRPVSGIFSREELATILGRRGKMPPLSNVSINTDIAGDSEHYYQSLAIRAVCNNIEAGARRSLLVMATGTGKTRVSAALVDVLMRGNRVKHALFLADRVTLVSQAKHAFQKHLPNTSLCDLCKNKNESDARIIFSTYPTILNAIDAVRNDDGDRLYTPAHFDLIIVDEAHRSIFKKYRDIFEYFDALVVGLTATPAESVDRNTYDFFEVEQGVPTYAYEYARAVNIDHVLVPYLGIATHTTFLDEGVTYDDLSDEDKERIEDDYHEEGEEVPDFIPESDVNSWFFNEETTNNVLETLMDKGIKVEGGETLGKTIIFAANRRHAEDIVERFGKLYPTLAKGGYIKHVVHGNDYAHTIIDEFKAKEKPVICVSVDMMDTGVDVPEVVNLVFFKKVRSKIKFWQMIGRGTRLCPGLDVVDPLDESHPGGSYADKERFYIFDWCRNFEYFGEGGDAKEGRLAPTLSEAVFSRQAQLAFTFQGPGYTDAEYQDWRSDIVRAMHEQVAKLSYELASVRLRRPAVEHFRQDSAWTYLSAEDLASLQSKLAPLVHNDETDVYALSFDVLMYGYMCALCEGSSGKVSMYQKRLVSISVGLQQMLTIPQVKDKMPTLQRVCEEGFLDGVSMLDLETIRCELRGIYRFFAKQGSGRKRIYTSVADPITDMEIGVSVMPDEDFADYRLKVNRYLEDFADKEVIRKLHGNEPLTEADFAELERIFTHELGTADDYLHVFGKTPFGLLVRQMVKLDHDATMRAFADLVNDTGMTDQQMAFVQRVIEYVEANGYMEPGALSQAPFDRPQSFVRLFDQDRRRRLVSIINEIKDNALRPVA